MLEISREGLMLELASVIGLALFRTRSTGYSDFGRIL